MHDLAPTTSEWVIIILTSIAIFGLANVGFLGRSMARLHRRLFPLPPAPPANEDSGNDQPKD